MSEKQRKQKVSRLSGGLFVLFVVASLAIFATIERRTVVSRQEDGGKAFSALFERRLAMTQFRVSPESQTAFMLASQEHGDPEEHIHEGSQFSSPMTSIQVWGYTRRRGKWFEERFQLGVRSKQISGYSCRSLGLDDKGFEDKTGLRTSSPPPSQSGEKS